MGQGASLTFDAIANRANARIKARTLTRGSAGAPSSHTRGKICRFVTGEIVDQRAVQLTRTAKLCETMAVTRACNRQPELTRER